MKRINWEKQPLGEVPDQVLANRLGVSRRTVCRARKRYASLIADRAQRAAMAKEDEFYGGVRICRDDRCTRVDIHPVHDIHEDMPDPFYDACYPHRREQHGETLRDIIYSHIPTRYCKPFQELYGDVLDDYGYVNTRAVYRALKVLVTREQITNVSPGKDKRLPGGYVRSDSPLLSDSEGREFLLSTLEDQRPSSWS
jgi:hypothetical protein